MTDLSKMKGALPLGQDVTYSAEYDPTLIAPIPRKLSRESLDINDELPFYGEDLWTGFELSWLQPSGVPTAYIARFYIPADSENIIESKSFKLYLNSYNDTIFKSADSVRERLERDLSAAAKATVRVELDAVSSAVVAPLQISDSLGECVDDSPLQASVYEPTPELLKVSSETVEEVLHSHLLKSNCPVTGQPDWATVIVKYRGPKIERSAFLAYVVSFRHHQDFHEHCAERMFLDLMKHCQCEELQICTRYTRRGGLDINPYRSTRPDDQITQARLIRQ